MSVYNLQVPTPPPYRHQLFSILRQLFPLTGIYAIINCESALLNKLIIRREAHAAFDPESYHYGIEAAYFFSID